MTRISTRSIVAGLLIAAAIASPAIAQTTDTASSVRQGIRAGDVLIRLRAIMVAPNEKSGSILPAFPGEHASVNSSFMPEIDGSYMGPTISGSS
jgi:outer membrane protein